MKQFLSIILRNQFNLYYRFGYTFIPKSHLVKFEGGINNEIKKRIAMLFSTISPFEYDEEYLILHLEKEINNNNDIVQFEIQDLVKIYPLSQQAKVSIESKIDSRIKLENPIFESLIHKIESKIEEKDIQKSISAIWTICKIEKPLDKYLYKIGMKNISKGLEHRKKGTKSEKIHKGSYWEYLIAYERYEYFPNSTLGYFYDSGQVFAFSIGQPTFEGSILHSFLEDLNSKNPEVKLLDIIKYLETEEKLKSYTTKTTKRGIKQYIIAPLFLMLRDEIRKSESIEQTKLVKNLDYLKKFKDSFNYAVLLLGAFFGFRKFYDIYYEALNLRFFKSYKPLKEENSNEVKKVLISTQTELKSSSNFQNNQENSSDNYRFYRKFIEDEISKQPEVKIADIVKKIKMQTNLNTQVKMKVEKAIENMSDIEIVKVRGARIIRKKGLISNLFEK